MNPKTPIDVLRDVIITSNFADNFSKYLNITDGRIQTRPLLELDVLKFDDYMMKCCGGVLNSILKRSPAELGEYENQMIVKNRIGHRTTSADGKLRKNGIYASTSNTFKVLNALHVPLVCRKEKREVVADFVKAKEDTMTEYNNIGNIAKQFVDDMVVVSDVHTISSKRPMHGQYSHTAIGHILINKRVVDKNDIVIKILDDGGSFGSDPVRYTYRPFNSGNGSHSSNIKIQVQLVEEVPKDNIYDPTVYNTTELFDVDLQGSTIPSDFSKSFKIAPYFYNTHFIGIDVLGLVEEVYREVDKLHDNLNARLNALKDKYAGEFYLSEMCTGEGAI